MILNISLKLPFAVESLLGGVDLLLATRDTSLRWA